VDQPDPEVLDALLSMAIAAGAGDDEAMELLLRVAEPADLAAAAADVIWRMATALGQLVDPPRSPPQMIHAFAQAMREAGDGSA
jgi:hypothetical protein